jgi:ABC-type iron transport system FetAB ATPase subunit
LRLKPRCYSNGDLGDFRRVTRSTNNLSAVQLLGVSKSYRRRTVLDDISLDVRRGEFLAIIGPSGGIVKVTIVRRDVTQHDKIVAGFMTRERATPSTRPTVFPCMFRG